MKLKQFLLLFVLIANISLFAQTSGTCGPNLTWTLQNGVLTISGTGEMSDFMAYAAPWNSERSNISSVVINTGVTSIGEWAFCDCGSLSSVIIPNGVTSIGSEAFISCSNLSSINIPNSVTSVGIWAFSACSSLTIPIYNSHLFAHMPTSSTGTYTIPEGIEIIAACAFEYCSGLTSVIIPNSVTNIGECAFYYCSGLSSVIIPNSVTSIGESAFYYCSGLTAVNIGNSVTNVGSRAFQGCSALTSVSIPNSVEIIGQQAFLECSSLTSVTIGNSVTSIGGGAFDGCPNLASVTCYAINCPVANYVFYNIAGSAILYVLNESLSTYASASDWNDYFSEIRPIATSVTIGSTGWASFSHGYPIDLTETNRPNGLAAYQVQAANIISEENTIAPSAINTSVAANTGLLLNGEEGTYDILVASSGSDLSSTNKLVAVTEDGTVVNNASYYVLMNNNGTAVFAHTGEHAATLNKGMAYLDLSGIALAPGILNIVEDMTDIEALGESQETIRKFINDGKLYIQRDGVNYDTLGRIVR